MGRGQRAVGAGPGPVEPGGAVGWCGAGPGPGEPGGAVGWCDMAHLPKERDYLRRSLMRAG
jgi:hypothetical protein